MKAAPEGWEHVSITARQLRDGDLYWAAGSMFEAQDVRYDQPCSHGDTRSCWTAVWLGVGRDPHPGWHRFGSAGNEFATMGVLRRLA